MDQKITEKPAEASESSTAVATDETQFRFIDNREKYLLFVTTCGEKSAIARHIGGELEQINPAPPALRLFDAGMGDATVLAQVMRQIHRRFPAVPLSVVAKEVSLEDVRLGLEKMPDRFFEHPETVLVVTNMRYTAAPSLDAANGAAPTNWRDVPLAGNSTHEFDEQIRALQPWIAEAWRTRSSPKTGNPIPVTPSVLVIYRKDRQFVLDAAIPQQGEPSEGYDLVLASQPYRARSPANIKVKNVIAPLSRALRPGGRLVLVQSTGRDPGMEIIRSIWPDEDPFRSPRDELIAALRPAIEGDGLFKFHSEPRHRYEFRYLLHALPGELGGNIGTSTLLAAWNAAVYVAQIEDTRLNDALRTQNYLKSTQDVLQKFGGLWFLDESFVVERLT